jgi:hypothetical protein
VIAPALLCLRRYFAVRTSAVPIWRCARGNLDYLDQFANEYEPEEDVGEGCAPPPSSQAPRADDEVVRGDVATPDDLARPLQVLYGWEDGDRASGSPIVDAATSPSPATDVRLFE